MRSPPDVGIELVDPDHPERCTAGERARVLPLLRCLERRGVDARLVRPGELCRVRIATRHEYAPVPRREGFRIFDTSDSLLTPPRRGRLRDLWFRLRTRRRLASYLRTCALVVAGSAAQAESFATVVAAVAIPDVAIYLEHADATRAVPLGAAPGRPLVFVWDGQGHNFPYLEALVRSCRTFFQRPDVQLRVVTDPIDRSTGRDNRAALAALDVGAELVPWRRETYVAEIARGDVGLAPVDLACPFARAKPENKAVGYLSLGLPAICSRTRAYAALAARCPAVAVCANPADWRDALERAAARSASLSTEGSEAQRYVAQTYGPEAVGERWLAVLRRFGVKT